MLCPGSTVSQGYFGLAGHSWTQAGWSAVDRRCVHRLPSFRFSLWVPFGLGLNYGWKAEGEKQQPFIAMATKKPLQQKETDGKTVCCIEIRFKSDTRPRKRKFLPISISGWQKFVRNTNSSYTKAIQHPPPLLPEKDWKHQSWDPQGKWKSEHHTRERLINVIMYLRVFLIRLFSIDFYFKK